MGEPSVFGFDPDTPDLLASLNTHKGELNAKLGIQITEVGRERLVGTMPVVGNRQPANLLHGGASAALAETLGSLHAAVLGPPGSLPVGIELSCAHHRSATSGSVTGVSTPIHAGRTLATFEIVISDDAGRRVCTARLSCLYRTERS